MATTDGPGAGDDRRRRLLWPVTVAAVGIVAIGIAENIPVRHSIEHQLADRSTHALNDAGLTGFTVRFTGRDGTVWVATAADSSRALSIVRAQTGVRVAKVIVGTAPGAPGPQAGGGPSTPAPSPSAAPSPSVSTPPATPPPSASPTPTTGTGGTQPLPQVQSQLNGLTAIQFDTGSATLTPGGRATVARVAAILRANPLVRVQIQVNTDNFGSPASNLALSRARAQAVFTALQGLGIAPNRMTTVGFGETHPKVPNDTPAHRATNRRVDFAASTP